MTGIQASKLNLRSASGEMTALSEWTFGDFAANLVASGLNMVGGYYLTLSKSEDNILTLTATGAETGTDYILATSAQAADANTTYKLKIDGNKLTLEASDGESTEVEITTADGNTTYELEYDDEADTLTLKGSDGKNTSVTIAGGIATDTDTTYTLTLDEAKNELVFTSSDEDVEPTRIPVNTNNYLDDKAFIAALVD